MRSRFVAEWCEGVVECYEQHTSAEPDRHIKRFKRGVYLLRHWGEREESLSLDISAGGGMNVDIEPGVVASIFCHSVSLVPK